MERRLFCFVFALVLLLVHSLPVLALTGSSPALFAGGEDAIFALFMLIFLVFFIACFWKIFEKAGEPGWASLIPIYNGMVMCRIAGKPEWWIFLTLIPFAGIVFSIIIVLELAGRFGKGGGFAVGMLLLPFIFYPILAFGDAEHVDGPPRSRRVKRKKRPARRDDDDEDDEPRPRNRIKTRRRDDDDDEDDDDRPRSRRRSRDDDEEEEERPRRRPVRRRDDDDE